MTAWQPLTPRGVAAFAGAPIGRLWLAQLIVALAAAGTVTWFVRSDWFPVVRAALSQLPAQGAIADGRLDWRGDSSAKTLAGNHFLALAVDLDHRGQARSPAHLQVEFGRTDFELRSLLGFMRWAYPRGAPLAFNRPELEPGWGAWSPAFLALTAATVAVGLIAMWTLLATVYSGPVCVVAFFANRQISWRGSWRLAGAALMPGALFFIGTIIVYGLGTLDLVRLIAAGAVHVICGWVYLVVSPWWLPRLPEKAGVGGNPFAGNPPDSAPEKPQEGGVTAENETLSLNISADLSRVRG